MSKQEFLEKLHVGIIGLPKEDIEDRLDFYREMIDDRMEEGLSEEEAVRAVGDVELIVSQIIEETPLAKLVKEKIKPKKRLRAGETVLLIVGSPLWISILVAVITVVFSLYIAFWSVIVSFWAVFVALACCAIGGVASGVLFVAEGKGISGVAMIGAAIVCAGLSILAFYGCREITKGLLKLTKKIAVGIKNRLVKKEEA